MRRPIVILPSYYAERIGASAKSYGTLDMRADPRGGVYVVDGFGQGQDHGGIHGGSTWVESHYLAFAQRERRAVWYHAEPELHAVGYDIVRRGAAIPLSDFRACLQDGWIGLSSNGLALAVTYVDLERGQRDWRAWILSEEHQSAEATAIQYVDEAISLLTPIARHWPLKELSGANVVVVGAGSIGSHAIDALASYGIRHMTVVDPDRLLMHNFSRHRSTPDQLGRFKVDAERERLHRRDPEIRVDGLPLDVIYDADVMRPLFGNADAILCAADGIDPRRTVNHLARRAGTAAVFACVLENGAFGEVLRVASPRVGCLLCARAHLQAKGGIAPEHGLDRGYGTGSTHLPMTAVGGDLGLVGYLAAKVVVATLLDRRGFPSSACPEITRSWRCALCPAWLGRSTSTPLVNWCGMTFRHHGTIVQAVALLDECSDRDPSSAETTIRQLAAESRDGRETGGMLLGRGPDAEGLDNRSSWRCGTERKTGARILSARSQTRSAIGRCGVARASRDLGWGVAHPSPRRPAAKRA